MLTENTGEIANELAVTETLETLFCILPFSWLGEFLSITIANCRVECLHRAVETGLINHERLFKGASVIIET